MKKQIFLLLLAIFVFSISIFFFGCVRIELRDKTECKYHSGASNAPSWICNPSEVDEYITGLGISGKETEQPKISTRREIAINRALQQIAHSINVKIETEQNIDDICINKNNKEYCKTKFQTITAIASKVTLTDVVEHANALDPIDGTYYVLLKMSKKKYEYHTHLKLMNIFISQKIKWESLFYNFSPKQVYEMLFSGNSNSNINSMFFLQAHTIQCLSQKIRYIEANIKKKEKDIKESIRSHYKSMIEDLKRELVECNCSEKAELFSVLEVLINQWINCSSQEEIRKTNKRIEDLKNLVIFKHDCDLKHSYASTEAELLFFQKIVEILVACKLN